MNPKKILVLTIVGAWAAGALATEWVSAPGCDVKFPTPLENQIGDKKVKLVVTGTAMRKKFIFNVYAVAGYIQEGVKVRSAAELAASNAPKQFHLVMVRDVDGPTMAEAFESAIRANYPAPAFDSEIKTLTDFMRSISVVEGDHVWLTHIPDVGFHCEVVGKTQLTIRSKGFSKAIWDIYLGPNNLGDSVKKGLTNRL